MWWWPKNNWGNPQFAAEAEQAINRGWSAIGANQRARWLPTGMATRRNCLPIPGHSIWLLIIWNVEISYFTCPLEPPSLLSWDHSFI